VINSLEDDDLMGGNKMKVGIIFGSKSDKDIMKNAAIALKEFEVDYEVHILSAHRVPERLMEVIKEMEENGVECIIAGAGLAAHLPGVIASHTVMPVIGVPIKAAIEGIDSLLSIVQMPKSIPVATVGINNSYNAGMLAVQILSLKDLELKNKLIKYRKEMKEKFIAENEEHFEF
jgi:5-(carboxyamino)imidazole ribonucleotide mutase